MSESSFVIEKIPVERFVLSGSELVLESAGVIIFDTKNITYDRETDEVSFIIYMVYRDQEKKQRYEILYGKADGGDERSTNPGDETATQCAIREVREESGGGFVFTEDQLEDCSRVVIPTTAHKCWITKHPSWPHGDTVCTRLEIFLVPVSGKPEGFSKNKDFERMDAVRVTLPKEGTPTFKRNGEEVATTGFFKKRVLRTQI